MRHRVKKNHFNRDTKTRGALLRSLLRNLVERGEITTTLGKAKELRRIADKLIHQAQDDSLASRRRLHTFFGKRDVVNTLVDKVAPEFTERTSGFTRIEKLGQRRGDAAEMATVSLIKMPTNLGTFKNPQPKKIEAKKPKAKPVAKKAAPKKKEK